MTELNLKNLADLNDENIELKKEIERLKADRDNLAIDFAIWLNDADKIIDKTKHIDFSRSDKEVASDLLNIFKNT